MGKQNHTIVSFLYLSTILGYMLIIQRCTLEFLEQPLKNVMKEIKKKTKPIEEFKKQMK
jgi:hypothetical protein